MSRAGRVWQPSPDLPTEIGGPPTFSMPTDLTGSAVYRWGKRAAEAREAIRRERGKVELLEGGDESADVVHPGTMEPAGSQAASPDTADLLNLATAYNEGPTFVTHNKNDFDKEPLADPADVDVVANRS